MDLDALEDEDDHDAQSNDEWNDNQPGSNRHNVEEYDDVFSAYLHARKRMNELRSARGFCCLVALGPEAMPRSQPPGGRGPGKTGPRGTEGGRGQDEKLATETEEKRTRHRLQTTTTIHSTWRGCGRTSHRARDCPLPITKRPRGDGVNEF